MTCKSISAIVLVPVLIACLIHKNIFARDSASVKPDSLYSNYGSNDHHEYDLTEECDVYITKKNSLRVYEFENVNIGMINDTTLLIYKEGFGNRLFEADRIKKAVYKNHSFWAGAGYGFAASVVFWGILGLATYQGGGHPDFGRGFGFAIGVLLGLPTGLLAGVISEFVTADDVYLFPGDNTKSKIKKLKYILKKHRKN